MAPALTSGPSADITLAGPRINIKKLQQAGLATVLIIRPVILFSTLDRKPCYSWRLDFVEVLLLPYFGCLALTGWSLPLSLNAPKVFVRTTFVWACLLSIPVTCNAVIQILYFCWTGTSTVAVFVENVSQSLSAAICLAIFVMHLSKPSAMVDMLRKSRDAYHRHLDNRSKTFLLAASGVFVFRQTIAGTLWTTPAQDRRILAVLSSFAPLFAQPMELFMRVALTAFRFGMTFLDFTYALTVLSYARCFGSLGCLVGKSSGHVIGSDDLNHLLAEYSAMVRLVRKFNRKFSVHLLLRYVGHCLWIITWVGKAMRVSAFAANVVDLLVLCGLTTTGMVYLADQAKYTEEKLRNLIRRTNNRDLQQSLSFVLDDVTRTPVAISLGEVVFVNREFVATIIGVLLTYILLLYDKSENVSPAKLDLLWMCNATVPQS